MAEKKDEKKANGAEIHELHLSVGNAVRLLPIADKELELRIVRAALSSLQLPSTFERLQYQCDVAGAPNRVTVTLTTDAELQYAVRVKGVRAFTVITEAGRVSDSGSRIGRTELNDAEYLCLDSDTDTSSDSDKEADGEDDSKNNHRALIELLTVLKRRVDEIKNDLNKDNYRVYAVGTEVEVKFNEPPIWWHGTVLSVEPEYRIRFTDGEERAIDPRWAIRERTALHSVGSHVALITHPICKNDFPMYVEEKNPLLGEPSAQTQKYHVNPIGAYVVAVDEKSKTYDLAVSDGVVEYKVPADRVFATSKPVKMSVVWRDGLPVMYDGKRKGILRDIRKIQEAKEPICHLLLSDEDGVKTTTPRTLRPAPFSIGDNVFVRIGKGLHDWMRTTVQGRHRSNQAFGGFIYDTPLGRSAHTWTHYEKFLTGEHVLARDSRDQWQVALVMSCLPNAYTVQHIDQVWQVSNDSLLPFIEEHAPLLALCEYTY